MKNLIHLSILYFVSILLFVTMNKFISIAEFVFLINTSSNSSKHHLHFMLVPELQHCQSKSIAKH